MQRRASCLQHLRKLWAHDGRRGFPALLHRGLWLRLLNLLMLGHALVIAVVVVGFGLHDGQLGIEFGDWGVAGLVVSVVEVLDWSVEQLRWWRLAAGNFRLQIPHKVTQTQIRNSPPACGGAACCVQAPRPKVPPAC